MTANAHLATTEHSPVAGLAHDTRGGISNPILGMLLFITSEVMFFAGLFAAYFAVRSAAQATDDGWPPQQFALMLFAVALLLGLAVAERAVSRLLP